MRFDPPHKKPLSNFAAEAAPLKGAVLSKIVGASAEQALVAANRELLHGMKAKAALA